MKDILLINIFGTNKTAIINEVTKILVDFEVTVLDIGQAVIHDQLNLGILVAAPKGRKISFLMEALKTNTEQLDMRIKCLTISPQHYQKWVDQQGKKRHIVTLLARKIRAQHLAAVVTTISEFGLKIDKITRLSGRVALKAIDSSERVCVEFSIRGEARDSGAFRASLLKLGGQNDIDIAYQQDTIYRRSRRLIVFDMDSTLIDAEVIDELAREAGVGTEVASITEAAMRGELDFEQSLQRRVSLLEGLPENVLYSVANRLRLNDGAEYLIKRLKQLGFKTAIVSGGFLFFARRLKSILNIDYVYAHELEIIEGRVTGCLKGDIIDGERKAQLLRKMTHDEGLHLEQVIAVGDGANDLPMLHTAGMGIAFRAKPLVQASVQHSISSMGLDGILYLLGYSDRDIEALGP